MRRPLADDARRCSPRSGQVMPQYGGMQPRHYPNTSRCPEKDCHRRTRLPPLSPTTSPRRGPCLSPSPAARTPSVSPRSLPPVMSSRQTRAASDPNPMPSPQCARVLPPVERRLSLPTTPCARSAPQPMRSSPRQFPPALPDTYRVKMNLKFPQPQPQFVPATDGPQFVHHPGAVTRTTMPVHMTLGLVPDLQIQRVASPSWDTLPTAPVQLVRCKQPHLVYPGQENAERQPVTPRDDRPASCHRRSGRGNKLGGFFRRFRVEKRTDDNAEG